MNDRAFIEEILGYLYSGFGDKKKSVETIFKTDIDDKECKLLDSQFKEVIDKIETLNKFFPIDQTRYKQKNDFYTLFSFVHENKSDEELLKYQYRILLFLDGKDKDGRQLIRPSNDECEALREYANNCVTQSNSKSARDNRLRFFNSVLKNVSTDSNEILLDILNYLSIEFADKNIELKRIGNYQLLNIDNL